MKKIKKGVKNTFASAALGAFLIWSLTGTYTLEFISMTSSSLPKLVDIDIDSLDKKTGDFTAVARGYSSLWEVAGTVDGQELEFEFTDPLSGERIVAVGKIDEDGTLTGKAANTNGEAFEWEATEGTAVKRQVS